MGKWQRIQFQPGVGIGPEGSRVTACEAHRTLSKEAAKEGMVLLKNKGEVLPLAEGSRHTRREDGGSDRRGDHRDLSRARRCQLARRRLRLRPRRHTFDAHQPRRVAGMPRLRQEKSRINIRDVKTPMFLTSLQKCRSGYRHF